MRSSKKNSNYLDKGKIIFIFNKSVNGFNTFCHRPVDDESYETLSLLNDAGEKLYESFEAAIKRTLVNHFRERQACGMISWPEYSAKKKDIELMSRDALIALQISENPTPLYAVVIDYTIIQRNAYSVTNAKKHKQYNVSKDKYCEVLPEIRKYISAYVDSTADLAMDMPEGNFTSVQASKLFSETNYFDSNGRWNHVLLIDTVSDLSETQRRALTCIKWSMILDLDPNSNENGLAAALLSQYKIQAARFIPDRPDRTQFNRFSTVPYWFYLNGINGLPSTLTNGSARRWNQKYASILYPAFQQYHATFEKRVKVVVLSSDTDRVSKIAESLDSVYEDDVQFLLLSSNHPSLMERYATLAIPLTADELARSILSNASLFDASSQAYACMMPSRDGTMVSIIAERFNHFELVHQNVAEEDSKIESRAQPELFYQGREQLSWYGARQGFAVARNEVVQKLKKSITEMDNSYGTFYVYHDPGIGGSTFARNFAYHMRMDQPVCILRQYTKEITATQLNNLYKELRFPILVFIDSSLISPDQVSAFENEIKPMSFPFIIINSRRKKNSETSNISLLNDFEYEEMVKRLEPYALPATLEILKQIKNSPNRKSERSPFFMSLHTFEENFAGINPYIRAFLREMTEEQREILVYLSISDQYANKPISEEFFPAPLISSDEEENSMWGESTAFDNLVILVLHDDSRVYRIRHHLFAEEIIKQIVYEDGDGKLLQNEAQASNLINFLVKFIRYSKTNAAVDYDTTLDILRNLFIVRDGQDLNRDRFSPLIEKVRSICMETRDGDNRAGIIFKTLVEVYSDDVHFLAHLSRFYSYVEKNYDNGVKFASEAVDYSEGYEGGKDPILHHIYGMSLKLRIREELKKYALECHERGELKAEAEWVRRIIVDTDKALTEFEKSRTANNQNAGYQAAIDLCIMALDLAKSLSGIEDTVDFIASDPAAWYMKYLDEAEGLMRSWKSDEDTNFYQLQGKIDEFYGDIESLDRTIAMWETALDLAKPEDEAQRRRLLTRAKQRRLSLVGYQNVTPQEIDEIISLIETNIRKEPKNSANIRIWFDSIRYCSSKDPEILLDEALDKLSVWKETSGSIEAYYYYFICNCIKAVEGFSRAEADIPILQSDLKTKSEKRYDNRYIYEWLGTGKGLSRLKRYAPSKMTPEKEQSLEVLTGYIENYKNPGSATIRSHNMEVFFNPKRAKRVFAKDSEGMRVSFSMGFSYDGLRAYDQSVDEVIAGENTGSLNPTELKKIEIGSRVKCRIKRNDLEFYIQAKLMDYHDQNGSIHIKELGSDYSVDNRPYEGNILYATVIGPPVKGFWQLTLRNIAQENEDNMPEWKRKLKDFGK